MPETQQAPVQQVQSAPQAQQQAETLKPVVKQVYAPGNDLPRTAVETKTVVKETPPVAQSVTSESEPPKAKQALATAQAKLNEKKELDDIRNKARQYDALSAAVEKDPLGTIAKLKPDWDKNKAWDAIGAQKLLEKNDPVAAKIAELEAKIAEQPEKTKAQLDEMKTAQEAQAEEARVTAVERGKDNVSAEVYKQADKYPMLNAMKEGRNVADYMLAHYDEKTGKLPTIDEAAQALETQAQTNMLAIIDLLPRAMQEQAVAKLQALLTGKQVKPKEAVKAPAATKDPSKAPEVSDRFKPWTPKFLNNDDDIRAKRAAMRAKKS